MAELNGKITTIDTEKRIARVSFNHLDEVTTYQLPYAKHVNPQINDKAAVILFSADMSDGLIIAVY